MINPLSIDYSSMFSHLKYENPIHIKNPLILEKREGKKWEYLSQLLPNNSTIYVYIYSCYLLNYDETPNYSMLKNLFL